MRPAKQRDAFYQGLENYRVGETFLIPHLADRIFRRWGIRLADDTIRRYCDWCNRGLPGYDRGYQFEGIRGLKRKVLARPQEAPPAPIAGPPSPEPTPPADPQPDCLPGSGQEQEAGTLFPEGGGTAPKGEADVHQTP